MNMKNLLLSIFVLLSLPTLVVAETVSANLVWTYNGTNTTGGFTLEKQLPGQTTWSLIADIPDPLARTHAFTFIPEVGRTLFRHRAYAPNRTGEWSDYAAYEYMEGDTIPKTTVILQYSIKQ